MFPGEIINGQGEIIINKDRRTERISVKNTGDRPVQVGSHYHFFEVNRFLSFDRESAYGMRLDIPSGTSVRFEPGEEKQIQLVEIDGNKRVFGLNDLTKGQATPITLKKAMHNAQLKNFV
ncbi:MAG: urease subunit beta [Cellulosilyticum sp.]|nr:urease subunit beta [Cellulosilyticum sp.]